MRFAQRLNKTSLIHHALSASVVSAVPIRPATSARARPRHRRAVAGHPTFSPLLECSSRQNSPNPVPANGDTPHPVRRLSRIQTKSCGLNQDYAQWMLAMVCDLPVPGGPIMTKFLPSDDATTAASPKNRKFSGAYNSAGDKRESNSRGSTKNLIPA